MFWTHNFSSVCGLFFFCGLSWFSSMLGWLSLIIEFSIIFSSMDQREGPQLFLWLAVRTHAQWFLVFWSHFHWQTNSTSIINIINVINIQGLNYFMLLRFPRNVFDRHSSYFNVKKHKASGLHLKFHDASRINRTDMHDSCPVSLEDCLVIDHRCKVYFFVLMLVPAGTKLRFSATPPGLKRFLDARKIMFQLRLQFWNTKTHLWASKQANRADSKEAWKQ